MYYTKEITDLLKNNEKIEAMKSIEFVLNISKYPNINNIRNWQCI